MYLVVDRVKMVMHNVQFMYLFIVNALTYTNGFFLKNTKILLSDLVASPRGCFNKILIQKFQEYG